MFDLPEWTGAPVEAPSPESRERFAGVRFQPVGKVYHYRADGFDRLKVGDWVIVDTVRGKQMGQVATVAPPKDRTLQMKRIERPATGRDMAMRHFHENRELEAMIACRAESSALRLPIKIVKAEYSFDGQTLTFLFSSDQEDRVETGELREIISRLYRARIEFRQISPREVAKIIGGMGACGIENRCCSRFLTEFSPISIKHAKEQGLSLNPHDITGMCGRLRCCLVYEYEMYVTAKRTLPKLKAIVGTPFGPGKVLEHLTLRDSVRVLVGDGDLARDQIVHREQIVPLEELKRLQDKALSGTCDKHEGGGCDCGKKGAPASAAPASQPSEAERKRGQELQRGMEARQGDRERGVRERGEAAGQRPQRPESRDPRRGPTPASTAAEDAARMERIARRNQQRDARRARPAEGQAGPPVEASAAPDNAPLDTPAPPPEQTRPAQQDRPAEQGRPARRPLARRKPTDTP
jgi:cell fate regulator YaaT (PSP1 superfamily)